MRLPLSNAKARAELGWRPAFPTWQDGLAQMAARKELTSTAEVALTQMQRLRHSLGIVKNRSEPGIFPVPDESRKVFGHTRDPTSKPDYQILQVGRVRPKLKHERKLSHEESLHFVDDIVCWSVCAE